MDLILQQSINAISLGGVYAMLALGLAIVFSIVRLINFAHGEIMTFGGYGIFLALSFGMPPLVALAMGVGAAFIMALAMERTAFRVMRAAAEGLEMLKLLGIRANRVVAFSFALSGLLAGIAAVIWTAQRGSVDPMIGFFPVLKAFIATVLGGLGSLGGAVLGGFVIGALEVMAQAFLPGSLAPYRDAIVLATIIGVLLWRPDGLLPAATGSRS